ncbi:unnamed protein product [Kluyveromyces dobzhanskii CBS 2104]|uniref:WGS project CCBQ000000000 data, contig 00014 n=1 Tax=Kluyveromyces dobzhanskii CBS 2104 TaxID=1427455 RepID=A0A0A8L908_9SACH|nr:unnamed protein product [Kluyveromyces dobzhanskii CBS 2104]
MGDMLGLTVPFKQVDVFTFNPYKGNPVAVINLLDVEESSVSQEKLQAIATWTNLSETTFLFKPSENSGADYKLRILTPVNELPFAGHPTVGSCQAFIEFTGSAKKSFKQECIAGIVPLTVLEDGSIGFQAIRTSLIDLSDNEVESYQAKAMLGIDLIARPKLLDVGPAWVVLLVKDNKTCYDAEVDYSSLGELSKKFGHCGIILAGQDPSDEHKYEMRAFAPGEGVLEDPVCGSGSVALARYLQDHFNFNKSFHFVISQGGRLNRAGRISVQIEHSSDGAIKYHVSGKARALVSGTIAI